MSGEVFFNDEEQALLCALKGKKKEEQIAFLKEAERKEPEISSRRMIRSLCQKLRFRR